MKKLVFFSILIFTAIKAEGMPEKNLKNVQNIDAHRMILIKDAEKNDLDFRDQLFKYMANLSKSDKKSQEIREIWNQIEKEISEIRKIVNFISFFISRDLVSKNEALKALRKLSNELGKWGNAPILGGRRTVQEVANRYGWGSVAEKLLKDIEERKNSNDSIKIISNMLLKTKSDVKKQLGESKEKSPSNYNSVIKIEEEILVPTEEVTKTLAECLSEFAAQNHGSIKKKKVGISISIKADDQTKFSDGSITNQLKDLAEKKLRVLVEKHALKVEGRLRKKVKNENLMKRMIKDMKENTLQNIFSRIDFSELTRLI